MSKKGYNPTGIYNFARLRTRVRAAIAWLEDQRQDLLAGEAVDAELATYRLDHQPILWQTWPD